MSPGWLTRIETLGTTVVVLMVGAMMIWYEAVVRGRRLVVTIGCAVILYAAVLVLSGAALESRQDLLVAVRRRGADHRRRGRADQRALPDHGRALRGAGDRPGDRDGPLAGAAHLDRSRPAGDQLACHGGELDEEG